MGYRLVLGPCPIFSTWLPPLIATLLQIGAVLGRESQIAYILVLYQVGR
jgi:hypothetical protein